MAMSWSFKYLVAWVLWSTVVFAEVVYYDSYTNAVLSDDQVAEREAAGTDYWCVNAFETCSPTEGRRLDGSCSNLKYPYAGAGTYAFKNLVPITSVPTKGRIPPSREVRTALLHSGWRIASVMTQLGMLFINLVCADFTPLTVKDVNNYLVHKTCCTPQADPLCVRVEVPTWDYMYRLTGVDCINLTRPIDFQSEGCIPADVRPYQRLNHGSASLDIKWMYAVDQGSSDRQRLFYGGLLNYTIGPDGTERPAFTAEPANPDDGMAGTGAFNYYFALIFWNEHNRIARGLGELNPSWSDQKLFDTARDINIAQYTQSYYYEALPILFNYENLVKDGVLSSDPGFRDVYDPSVLPGFWTESLYAYRWFHTIQRVDTRRYTVDGVPYDNFPESVTELPLQFNSGLNLTYFSQGVFRTNSAKDDDLIDPFMSETLYYPWHRANDLGAYDIEKGRLTNVAPYVDVLKECEGKSYENYESLNEHLDEDTIVILKHLYGTDEPSAVDLMAGLWREKFYEGSQVPRTVYCLAVRQLLRMIHSDRHWYERPNRPNAFSAAQLSEIRKASMARLMCDNMPGITYSGISAKAFLPLSDTNPIVSCDSIARVELSAWAESGSTSQTTSQPESTSAGTSTTTVVSSSSKSTSTETSPSTNILDFLNNGQKWIDLSKINDLTQVSSDIKSWIDNLKGGK